MIDETIEELKQVKQTLEELQEENELLLRHKEFADKTIDMYAEKCKALEKELEYMTTERNMYASQLADLQEWAEAEISEWKEAMDSSWDCQEAINNQLAVYQKVLDKLKELV